MCGRKEKDAKRFRLVFVMNSFLVYKNDIWKWPVVVFSKCQLQASLHEQFYNFDPKLWSRLGIFQISTQTHQLFNYKFSNYNAALICNRHFRKYIYEAIHRIIRRKFFSNKCKLILFLRQLTVFIFGAAHNVIIY